MSDEEVDAGSARRDAFTALYRRHLTAVRGHVRVLIAVDDVDEIVSATFMTAWDKFDEIPPGLEKAWLLGVARHHCLNRYRSRGRTAALTEAIGRIIPPPTDPYDDGPDPAEVARVRRALASLHPDEQELLTLAVWQDLAPAEIAVVLGVRQGTVRVRLHRARRRLGAEYHRLRAQDGGG